MVDSFKRFTPRKPTLIEVVKIKAANLAHFGDDYEPDYIAVWDNYISDCPGYCGWVALSFGGVPDFVTGYCIAYDNPSQVEVCSFGDDQGFLKSRSTKQLPLNVGHPDEIDDREFGGEPCPSE